MEDITGAKASRVASVLSKSEKEPGRREVPGGRSQCDSFKLMIIRPGAPVSVNSRVSGQQPAPVPLNAAASRMTMPDSLAAGAPLDWRIAHVAIAVSYTASIQSRPPPTR